MFQGLTCISNNIAAEGRKYPCFYPVLVSVGVNPEDHWKEALVDSNVLEKGSNIRVQVKWKVPVSNRNIWNVTPQHGAGDTLKKNQNLSGTTEGSSEDSYNDSFLPIKASSLMKNFT